MDSKMSRFAAVIVVVCLSDSLFTDTIAQACNCIKGRRAKYFASCRDKNPPFRSHTDIGLVDDCLPRVPVNEMRCFKWRIAEQCDDHLRCSLQQKDEQRGVTVTDSTSVTMYSPGHSRISNRARPYYSNRYLCIYNVSLSCQPHQKVLLRSIESTSLADDKDYLWFSPPLRRNHHKVSGNVALALSDPDELDAFSFTTVLWTSKHDSSGQFGIEARCEDRFIHDQDPVTNETSGDGEILQF